MVLAAEAAQEDFALIDRGVEFAVAVHVGELDEVGRVRDDDDVVEDRDAERGGPAGVLHEGVGRVGLAGALGIAEHHDAIAFGATLAALIIDAVVDAFGHPHAALSVDVQVSRVGQHGRTRPHGDLQALGDLEEVERHGTAFGRRVGCRGGRKGDGGHEEAGETGHASITRASPESSSLTYRPAVIQDHQDRKVAKSAREASIAFSR